MKDPAPYSVLVCGGRNYYDELWLRFALDTISHRINLVEVVEGGARGADELAGAWADLHGKLRTTIPADWAQYGKRAGPIRNRKMLEYLQACGNAHMVIAFPGGSGTANMVAQAEQAGIKILRVSGNYYAAGLDI